MPLTIGLRLAGIVERPPLVPVIVKRFVVPYIVFVALHVLFIGAAIALATFN